MNKESGLSLYLSIIIMSIILSIVFGISSILLVQLLTIKGMENSVVAFYAADTGIEHVLVDRIDPTIHNGYSETLDNGASFDITAVASGVGGCTATSFCIKSVGTYKNSRRAIEVKY